MLHGLQLSMNLLVTFTESKMGKSTRKKRDGTGPYKDAFRKTGRRKARGEPCPAKKK